jgi:hypothetical protein
VTSEMRGLHDLSRLVLVVLAAQKMYFRTRSQDDLIKSKQLEKQLKAMAESYLEVDQL